MFTVDSEATTAEGLWRDHVEHLRRFATVLVGPFDAHDVVTDAFWAAWPRVAAGGIRDPRAYLIRAVANRVHDRRRGEQRRARREQRAAAPALIELPAEHTELRRAIRTLTVQQRAIVYLAYWDDLSEREIAEVLDLSPGTVHRTLDRAREALRKAL